ncbi:hypothetical protein ACFQ0X_39250 [Streptomyces rectiviolaceus]|uniref:Uncharacterized protein n=1 Tax=Streptomyces rectiviolaceus TaxID=332591 RepID=A0ABP6MA73_9ACTN
MRPQEPRTIEEALARARIFEGDYTAAHQAASQRRITEQLLELRWMQTLAEPHTGSARPARAPLLLHEQAAVDLRALCQGVIHDDDAVHRLARFDTFRDSGGALAFACLLVLADREEGAQFWLQFAAGGGEATGALCLYLLHLRRGEWRDARHWAQQMSALEDWPSQYTPVPHEVVDAAPATCGGVKVYINLPDHGAAIPESAVKGAMEDLDVDQVGDFNAVPQPSPELAHQLEDLVTAGR